MSSVEELETTLANFIRLSNDQFGKVSSIQREHDQKIIEEMNTLINKLKGFNNQCEQKHNTDQAASKAELNAKIKELEDIVTLNETEHKNLLESCAKEKADLQTQVETLTNQLQANKTELELLRTAQSTDNESNSDQRRKDLEQIAQLKTDNDGLTTTIDQLKTDIELLTKELAALQSKNNNELQTLIDELQDKLKEEHANGNTLTTQLAEASNKMEAIVREEHGHIINALKSAQLIIGRTGDGEEFSQHVADIVNETDEGEFHDKVSAAIKFLATNYMENLKQLKEGSVDKTYEKVVRDIIELLKTSVPTLMSSVSISGDNSLQQVVDELQIKLDEQKQLAQANLDKKEAELTVNIVLL